MTDMLLMGLAKNQRHYCELLAEKYAQSPMGLRALVLAKRLIEEPMTSGTTDVFEILTEVSDERKSVYKEFIALGVDDEEAESLTNLTYKMTFQIERIVRDGKMDMNKALIELDQTP